MTVTVRAPATSANLGPGYDSLGLALALYDEVVAEPAAGPSSTVVVTGEGAGELPTGPEHLVVRSMVAAFDAVGMPAPAVALRCHNRIPQARGLGSSSAAIVAGVLVARGLIAESVAEGTAGEEALAPFDDHGVVRLAARLEGHPDNVAPCVLGGFTIAWTEAEGAQAVRLTPAAGVRPTCFVPADRGYTATARAALPAQVPHADAAHAVSRAALLVPALTVAPELLLAATEDRLHQDYRAPAAPETAALVARLRAAGVPAVVSGAGPSVLALSQVPAPLREQPGWLCHEWEVDSGGARVTSDRVPTYTEQERMTRRQRSVLPQLGQVV